MRLVVLVVFLAATACGAASPKNADLVADIRGYSDGMRWRDFNAAALRLVPARRTVFMDQREQLDEDLRIADWELKRLTYSEDRNRAEVHIEWTWLLDSRGIVHTTVTRQAWSRHGKNWILDREERLRGEPMPGLAEPKPVKRRTARSARR
jgi:hypothetical protein